MSKSISIFTKKQTTFEGDNMEPNLNYQGYAQSYGQWGQANQEDNPIQRMGARTVTHLQSKLQNNQNMPNPGIFQSGNNSNASLRGIIAQGILASGIQVPNNQGYTRVNENNNSTQQVGPINSPTTGSAYQQRKISSLQPNPQKNRYTTNPQKNRYMPDPQNNRYKPDSGFLQPRNNNNVDLQNTLAWHNQVQNNQSMVSNVNTNKSPAYRQDRQVAPAVSSLRIAAPMRSVASYNPRLIHEAFSPEGALSSTRDRNTTKKQMLLSVGH